MPDTCTLTINVFDGSRQPMPPAVKIRYTARDGNQKVIPVNARTRQVTLKGLPFFNNFGDLYTVLASAGGYEQAGFTPLKVSPNSPQSVDLMLLGTNATFNFSGARWEDLPAKRPVLARVLSAGASAPAARDRYSDLLENHSPVLACLLNITTAMEQIHLAVGSPLDYFQQLIWDDSMKQDRFFAYADARLVDQVRQAVVQGAFAPEAGSSIFHPGATSSYKQVEFGEANVQLTFHEDDKKTIGGIACIKVEPDIDYYKNTGSHTILEVIRNNVSGSLTDPRQVYVLRWIAGRRSGVPEFDPLYTIV